MIKIYHYIIDNYSKYIKSFLLVCISSVILLSLVSYSPTDPSFNLSSAGLANNLLGLFGAKLADLLLQIFGLSALLFPIALVIWAVKEQQKTSKLYHLIFRMIILFFAAACLSKILDIVNIQSLPAGASGVVGSLLHQYLAFLPFVVIENYIPIKVFYAVCCILLIYLSFGLSFKTYVLFVTKFTSLLYRYFGIKWLVNFIISLGNKIDYGTPYELKEELIGANKLNNRLKQQSYDASKAIGKKPTKSPERKIFNGLQAPAKDVENLIPPLDLLDVNETSNYKKQTPQMLAKNAEDLMKVLGDFGIEGKMLEIKQGPVVTLYEFEPSAGTKSSRIIGLADDIARSLSALSTRISVIAGKNALGIELPNENRMFFCLRALLEEDAFQNQDILLPLVLGKDLGGKAFVADLAKMPHLLVAGTTGSGKSVAINAMILSLLYRYSPDDCKMILIDPKMLELSIYDNIPHLMTPVVTEAGRAITALKWAVKEMENRYRLMSNLGVRNIGNYNKTVREAKAKGEKLERKIQTGFDAETGNPIYEQTPIELKKMPFIVIIVDEMADLMIVAGKDIEASIQRLAQMARAAGIHIIMATQRPSVDVITGVIKANFPSRISFKVTSKIDSRTILGEQGSEQLLGMGDMLYMGSSSGVSRVHGPFVDDKEVERVTSYLRKARAPEYIADIVQEDDADMQNDVATEHGSEGELYNQAINIVKIERKASISYIQRSLRIGYNRAANLVEQMERDGVLSAPNHSGKRQILIPEN